MDSLISNQIEPPENPVAVVAGKPVLGLRIPDTCMVYRVQADIGQVQVGDQVMVQLGDAEVIGQVLHVFSRPVELHPGPILKVIRRLTEKDQKFQLWRVEQEKKAQVLCREKIREMQLAMKFSKVIYQSGGGKAIIYFTSESRIDFRELVRILSAELRVRVEMRHVGVRDESKLLCGLGSCGKTLCCSEFLTKFHPVSVRMAKNQDLSLTPEGISGVCGRLMCCLAYENEAYLAQRKLLPKAKSKVILQDGREGTVRVVFPMLNLVEIQFGDGAIEKLTVNKLAGEFGEQSEEVPEELPEELQARSDKETFVSKAPASHSRPAHDAPKTVRGRPEAEKPGSGVSPVRRAPTATPSGKEPSKNLPSSPFAPLPRVEGVPRVEGIEVVEGSVEPVKRRSNQRRRRRGGNNRAVETLLSLDMEGNTSPLSTHASKGAISAEGGEARRVGREGGVSSEGEVSSEGAQGGGPPRVPGRSRRRRRSSSSRRPEGGGAASGGEGGGAASGSGA